jgi:hypothetical protein
VRNVRMLGLFAVAAVAVMAIAATSASALPEWGQCFVQPNHEGKYTDAGCTKKAKKVNQKFTGEYEWRKGTEVTEKKFEGGNVGSGGVLSTNLYDCLVPPNYETEGRKPRQDCAEYRTTLENVKVECESEVNHGEAAGSKDVKNVTVSFRGCKLFGSAPCSNTPSEGEIQVNPLKGSLGYIDKTTKEVGVLLTPAKSKGEFAKFNCAGILSTVVGVGNKKEGAFYLTSGCYGACPGATPEEEKHGGYDGIISPITPINTMATEFTQTYTINEELYQNVPTNFFKKHIELLEDYVYNAEDEPEQYSTLWSPAGETITNVNHQTGAEAVEIKA